MAFNPDGSRCFTKDCTRHAKKYRETYVAKHCVAKHCVAKPKQRKRKMEEDDYEEEEEEDEEEIKPARKRVHKKGMSSLFIFIAEERDNFQKLCPKLSFNQVSQELATMWKHLDPKLKAIYDNKARK